LDTFHQARLGPLAMSNYAIYRHEKCGHKYDTKTGAMLNNNWTHLQKMVDELTRQLEKAEPNWDPTLSKNNIWLYDAVPGGINAENVAKYVWELVWERAGQKIRKNACLLVENYAGFSPDMMGIINVNQWAQDTCAWAKKKFGENLLGVVLHLDEKTPHIHIISIPLVTGKDGKKRLNARALLGGPLGASKLANEVTEYSKAMAHHGLKRGAPTVETGVTHVPLKVLQAEKREKLQNAAALKEVLRQPFDKLLGQQASIAHIIDMFSADVESDILTKAEKKRTAALLKKQEEELAQKERLVDDLADQSAALEREVARLQALLDEDEDDNGPEPKIGPAVKPTLKPSGHDHPQPSIAM
jgi:plasmid recombination enzyme